MSPLPRANTHSAEIKKLNLCFVSTACSLDGLPDCREVRGFPVAARSEMLDVEYLPAALIRRGSGAKCNGSDSCAKKVLSGFAS